MCDHAHPKTLVQFFNGERVFIPAHWRMQSASLANKPHMNRPLGNAGMRNERTIQKTFGWGGVRGRVAVPIAPLIRAPQRSDRPL